MTRCAGAGAATVCVGAGCCPVGVCAGAGCVGVGAAWASRGAADPPSTVPTINSAPARRLLSFDLEITRPRLVCAKVQQRASSPSPGYCPTPRLLSNQAFNMVPDAEIVAH